MNIACKRVSDSGAIEDVSLLKAFDSDDSPQKEHWLFVTAHDDDPIIGAGILLWAAKKQNIKVSIVIVTDGGQGYRDLSLAGMPITVIRKKETSAAYRMFGIEEKDIHYLEYPDSDLQLYAGRRKSKLFEMGVSRGVAIAGHTGLLNSLVYMIRKLVPTKVMLHSTEDFHPDHKLVYAQAHWANFFAAGDFWPELGAPLLEVPALFEYIVYADFTEKPSIQLKSEEGATLRNKAIRVYESQGEIYGLISDLELAGPYEWHRRVQYKKVDRKALRNYFEGD